MDRDFMKSFYEKYYADPQKTAVKDSEEYIKQRELRYDVEERFVKLLSKSDDDLEQLFEEYLDACADEIEILLGEMYLLGASDREKMLKQ